MSTNDEKTNQIPRGGLQIQKKSDELTWNNPVISTGSTSQRQTPIQLKVYTCMYINNNIWHLHSLSHCQ